jgi:TonB family protein
VFLAFACAGQDVSAQEPLPATPVDAQDVHTLREISLFPYSEDFPSEAKAQRLSGEVVIRADALATGTLANVRVETSSGSPVLDDAALAVVAKLGGKPRDADAPPLPLRIPIGFSLDSLQTLSSKTCGEFNQDFAQYRTLRPGATAADMRVFDLASGAWVSMRGTMALDVIKRLPSAPGKVAGTCSKRPDSKFLDAFMDAMR